MNKNATTIATWAHAITRTLESFAIDGMALCRDFGIDTQRLMDPNYRIPVSVMTPLWRECVSLTGDSAFGLKVAEHVSPTTFHALGFAAMASRDFKEVATRIMGNSDLISEVAQINLEMKPQEIWFCIRIKQNSPDVSDEAIDAFMGAFVEMGRKYVGVDMPLTTVYMQRKAPDDEQAFQQFFEVPLHFSADVNALVCPISVLNNVMPSYNPALLEANEKVLRDYKANQSQNLSNQIIETIEDILPDEPLQAKVAERLNMSVRKMQRLLSAEEKSYQALLDELRREKALRLIAQGRVSLKVIAHQLGFANQSAFTRAFRRWTGQTPNQVLKNKSK